MATWIEKLKKYRRPMFTVIAGLFFAMLLWALMGAVGIESVLARLIVIGVLVLLIAGCIMGLRFIRARRARLLEESFHKQAMEQIITTRPDRKAQIEAIRLQFEKAVSALKESKLGQGWGGENALYALPWYMLLGPTASGKSTALLRSGLQFPFVGDSGKGVQGIGGTRNCDWWFTNEAVLLDTSGRYTTEDEDREEWLGFLDLLKEYRRGKPINGVLIVVSLQDIVNGSDEHVEWHAKNIRTRVNELIQQLELIFPVYLIFSKCDLVRGFAEFFSNLDRSEREQVWGCTLSQKSNNAPHKLFQTEFQVLLDALQSRRVSRLSTAMAAQKARDIFCYPFQLSFLQQRLAHFVELLFQPSAYQENPIFRGFYFTSGTQGNPSDTPSDKILASVTQWAGLPEMTLDHPAAHDEPKGYFIKNIFSEVVCKDHILSGPSSTSERRRQVLKMSAIAASILFMVGGVWGLAYSYIQNKSLAAGVQSAWQQALQVHPEASQFFTQNVHLLAPFRARIDDLEGYKRQGLPLKLQGGMYRGAVFHEPSKDVYFQLFNSLYLPKTQSAIETELRRFVSKPGKASADRDSDYYYSLLKAYLMMAEPGHLDRAFLNRELQVVWSDLLPVYSPNPPADLVREVAAQMDLYSRTVNEQRVPVHTIDKELVDRTRRALREMPLPERYFARIRRETASINKELVRLEPYSLDKALGEKQGVLVSDYTIPALFTPAGWSQLFPLSLEKVLREAGQEGWVIDAEEVPKKEMEAAIEQIFFTEYVSQWKQFLGSIKVQPAGTAITRLQNLAQKNSPIVLVLKDVDRNTRFESLFDATKERITKVGGIFRKPGAPGEPVNPAAASFQSLHEFILPSADKKESGLDRYMAELTKTLNALTGEGQSEPVTQELKGTTGLRRVDMLVQELDTPIRNEVRSLLIQPFQVVQKTKTVIVFNDLARSLRQEVTGPCLQMVAGRYPFGKSAEEMSFGDLAAYFHPQSGTFWKFYHGTRLHESVQEEDGRWVAKDMDISPSFLNIVRDTDLITQGFFGKGTSEPKMTFDIRPNGVPGVDEIRLEIDGKQLRYQMGTEEWEQFVWPGSPEAAGASLLIVPSGASQPRSKHFQGRWGLFKLLDAGRVIQIRPGHYQVEWEFAEPGGVPIKVRVDLKAESTKNPFARGLLNRFHCPSQLG